MSELPVKYLKNIHRGTDFVFQFRFKYDGEYTDLTGSTVFFDVSDSVDGTNLFSFSSADSPETITIDANNNWLVTVTIPRTDTLTITQNELYYQIDKTGTDGLRLRYAIGSLPVLGDAE